MSEDPDPISAEQPQPSEEPSPDEPSSKETAILERTSVEDERVEDGPGDSDASPLGAEALKPNSSLGGSARELLNPDGSLRQA